MFTELRWNGIKKPPESDSKSWGELTSKEQSAARELCFEVWSWNGNELPISGASSGGGLACFSGNNKAEVLGKGPVKVEDLKIGDYVLASQGKYSRVYSFSHLDPDMEIEYLQIYVSGRSKPLEISEEHMLLVNNKMYLWFSSSRASS